MMRCNFMKDLNFFSSYNKKRVKVINKTIVFYGFIVALISIIIIYALLNFMSIRKLNNEVSILKEKYEVLNNDEKIKEINSREQYIRLTKENLETLNALDSYVNERDIINGPLLEEIRESIPQNIFLDSILINIDNIRIEGKSKDKESISQFQYNLSLSEDFNSVFIPEVILEDSFYSFYIDITLGEEKTIGTQVQNK